METTKSSTQHFRPATMQRELVSTLSILTIAEKNRTFIILNKLEVHHEFAFVQFESYYSMEAIVFRFYVVKNSFLFSSSKVPKNGAIVKLISSYFGPS